MLLSKYKSPLKHYKEKRFFDLFDEFNRRFDQIEDKTSLFDFSPTVNTREGQAAYHIEADLPGIKKENIDLNINGNILTISGKREVRNEVKEENYYKTESSFGSFSRSFTLPEKIDVENIKATFVDGVLEVIIPKCKIINDTVKKINIKS